MTDLKKQRKMAAQILKCGVNRVYITDNPEIQKEIAKAITRDDLRQYINAEYVDTTPKMRPIDKRQKKGVSRGRHRKKMEQKAKGRRKGPGSRKGAKYARFPKKKRWIQTIRPIRAFLKDLRDSGKIDKRTYRHYYLLTKGGMFRSKAHLKAHLIMDGHLKKEEEG